MSSAYNLANYRFHEGERILIDANIWLYLYPAPVSVNCRYTKQYSNAFKQLFSAKAQPILDPIILSEYINRYARIEWKAKYELKYPQFKKFRNSTDFTDNIAALQNYARRIISSCELTSTPANCIDLSQIMTRFLSTSLDFNDALLEEICKKENLKLMTNDRDFKSSNIEILTTNPKIYN